MNFYPFGSIIVIVLILIFISIFLSFVPIGLWVTAFFSGVRIKISELIGMKLRRVKPSRIVRPAIKATKAGLNLEIASLEAHYLAGGNVNTLVDALIAAQRANIPLQFERAAAIDLAGRDVLEAVQVSVNPKVIETPNISAVAQDGIEVIVKAKTPKLPLFKASAMAIGTCDSASTTFALMASTSAFISCSRARAMARLSLALASAILLSASAWSV